MTEQESFLGRRPSKTWPRWTVEWTSLGVRVQDLSVAAGTFIFIAGWVIPFLQTPYVLDSIWFISQAQSILANGFSPVVPAAWDSIGHPVLLQELLAISWLVFGQALWVAHAVIGVFAFLLAWYTYRVASLLYDRQTGALAALLLLFYPLFRAQSTVFMLDLPAATFAVIAIYFTLRRKMVGYLLFGSAMVLTKETSVLLVPTVLAYEWATARNRLTSRQLFVSLVVHSVPVVVLGAWFWYHLQTAGWFPPTDSEIINTTGLLNAYLPPLLFTRNGALAQLLDLVWSVFGKWHLTGILTLLVIAYSISPKPFAAIVRGKLSGRALIHAVKAQPVWHVWGPKSNLVLLGLPIAIHLVFSASGNFMERYLLLELALFFILASRAILGRLSHRPTRIMLMLVVLTVFTTGWFRPWFGYSLASPSNLLYADYVATHQAAAAYIEREYPGKTVLANWPAYAELSMPVLGYVSNPIPFLTPAIPTRSHELRIQELGGRSFANAGSVGLDDFDLLYYSKQALSRDQGPTLLSIAQRLQLTLIVEFRTNGEYAAIYANRRALTTP